jgi:bacterioferritin-associated ferredoxin
LYICICKGITEEALKQQANPQRGKSQKEILNKLGIGKDCGVCFTHALNLLNQEKQIQTHHQNSAQKK